MKDEGALRKAAETGMARSAVIRKGRCQDGLIGWRRRLGRMQQEPRDPDRFLGVAGPTMNDQEKASIKQAVFLIRYRLRLQSALGLPAGA